MGYEEQRELEDAYVMGTYGRKPVQLVSGAGMTVRDDKGNEYLDFIAGVGADSLGHCHPAVVGALKKQAETLIHVSNYYYIQQRGEVAQSVSDLLNECVAQGERAPWKSFFSNSGAEANECAIKLARVYARRQAAARAKAAGASDQEAAAAENAAPRIIVTLDRSFHGRTLATLAATAQPAKQELFQPLPDGFVSTPINDIAALEDLFNQLGDAICAIMVECVQGESGVHPCTSEFLQAARRLTQERGAVLICDEVQCGIYRCGTHPFGFQHFGITPDIVTIAKGIASGMPCGMCAAKADVADAFNPGDHGSTFGGSCLAIAAMAATLQALQDQGIAQNAMEVGAYLEQQLTQLPGVVGVRGLGLMVAADLDEGLDAPSIVLAGLDCGLLLNYTGPHTLRFLPPLICTKQDVDVLLQRLGQLLAAA